MIATPIFEQRAEIDAGPIFYEDVGDPGSRPVVFVHGYLMGPSLWRPLAMDLAARGLRCVAPRWPLGAHRIEMNAAADMTLPGIAAMVGDLLELLALDDVVLVGNDTGGVVAQLVAVHHGDRVGALVLTSCDAFEHFPPPVLKNLIFAARLPLSDAFFLALQSLRIPSVRRRSFAPLAHRGIEPMVREWVRPATSSRAVARNLRALTASLTQETTLEVGRRLQEISKPALVAWSDDDQFFPLADGRRLATALPNSRFEIVKGARTFSMIDQPERLGELVAAVAARP